MKAYGSFFANYIGGLSGGLRMKPMESGGAKHKFQILVDCLPRRPIFFSGRMDLPTLGP